MFFIPTAVSSTIKGHKLLISNTSSSICRAGYCQRHRQNTLQPVKLIANCQVRCDVLEHIEPVLLQEQLRLDELEHVGKEIYTTMGVRTCFEFLEFHTKILPVSELFAICHFYN